MIVRSIYKRKFEISGYEVATAEEGTSALNLLNTFKPDAIQVDIMLPGMDGVEVIRQIRSWPDFKNVPILVISSFYRPDLAAQAWKAGATKCVSKMDCTPNLALELIEQMVNKDHAALTPVPATAIMANDAIRLRPAESPWEEATQIITRKPKPAAGAISFSMPEMPAPSANTTISQKSKTLPNFARKEMGLAAPPALVSAPSPAPDPASNAALDAASAAIPFTAEAPATPSVNNTGLFVKPDPCVTKMTTRPKFAIPPPQRLAMPPPTPKLTLPTEAAPSAPEFSAGPAETPTGEAAFRQEVRQEFLKRAPQIQNELRDRVSALLKSKSTTDQIQLLADLEMSIASLSSLSGITGFSRISHLSGAMDALIKDLRKKPAQMTNSVLRTVAHASDCLNTLFRDLERGPRGVPNSSLILAVDDEPIARRTISVALSKANLRCIGMEDPKAALAMLRENSFDLIFLDAEMPGLNGFELCAELRKLSTNKNTPVIFVTSLTKFEIRAQSSLSGGNDLIAKPFLMMELAVKALTYLLKPAPILENKPAAVTAKQSLQLANPSN